MPIWECPKCGFRKRAARWSTHFCAMDHLPTPMGDVTEMVQAADRGRAVLSELEASGQAVKRGDRYEWRK